jgi:hypothetical protein
VLFKIVTLPEQYLEHGRTRNGAPKVKADLDGCVARGMSKDDWQRIKDQSKEPWDLDIPLKSIVEAIATANPDEFLKSTRLKSRLENSSVDEVMVLCTALSEALKVRSYDFALKVYDISKFEAYCKRALEWSKNNGLTGVTIRTFKRAVRLEAETENIIAHCMAEDQGRVVMINRGRASEIVATFILLGCAYGEARYTGTLPQRRYRVKVQSNVDGKPQIREIELDGDLYSADQYTKKCPDLSVADPKHFKMYVGEKLASSGFQIRDERLDTVLFTGLHKESECLVARMQIAFPRGPEDCWYNNANFPTEGDGDASLKEIAAISRFADVLFILGNRSVPVKPPVTKVPVFPRGD